MGRGETRSPRASGARRLPSSNVPVEDRAVGIHAPVTKERPVPPHAFDEVTIALGDEDVFTGSGLRDDTAEGIGDERVPEELDAARARLVLVPDTIGSRHVDA